jgi:nitroreductase
VTARGLGVIHLLCPAEHELARLIKPAAHLSIQISVPGEEHADWPREEDMKTTAAYCSTCAARFSGDSWALFAAMASLARDELEHELFHHLNEERPVRRGRAPSKKVQRIRDAWAAQNLDSPVGGGA